MEILEGYLQIGEYGYDSDTVRLIDNKKDAWSGVRELVDICSFLDDKRVRITITENKVIIEKIK